MRSLRRRLQALREPILCISLVRAADFGNAPGLRARSTHLTDVSTSQLLRSCYLARTSRWIAAKTIAAETPNMRAPFVASNGPSKRHAGVRTRSP